MLDKEYACLTCGHEHTANCVDLSSWTLVSSDCRPKKAEALAIVCEHCQTIQKIPTAEWLTAIGEIYNTYQIYHQSGGKEQKVPSQDGQGMDRRSKVLLDRVFSHVALPEQGRVLDYGCGNGALLRSFHELKPGWNISGADIGGHFKEEILSISEGAKFYNVANEKIDAKFDMISLLHCLEHLVDGRDILQDLSGKLSENGILFIQVPNAAVNPFDLLIYDHIFHFTPDTLSEKLKRAGFERVCILSSADEKEISMVAGPGVPDELLREGENQHADDGLELFRANISFLEKCEKKFLSLKSDNRKLGIFGTSIAGTWLSASCNGIHDFFVDEDVERTGRKYHDRDVLLPDNVPEHAVVFVPLPPKIATKVMDRLDSERLVYCSIDQ